MQKELLIHWINAIISDVKWGPKKASLTTADLQLSEACALVETLPKWTVVDKVRSHPQVAIFKLIFFYR